MKAFFLLLSSSILCANGLAHENSTTDLACKIISRTKQIDQFIVRDGALPLLKFFEIKQNDETKVNYRTVVASSNGMIEIQILNNDKAISMGSWDAPELLARGEADVGAGSGLLVETGFESKTMNALLSIHCKRTEEKP